MIVAHGEWTSGNLAEALNALTIAQQMISATRRSIEVRESDYNSGRAIYEAWKGNIESTSLSKPPEWDKLASQEREIWSALESEFKE